MIIKVNPITIKTLHGIRELEVIEYCCNYMMDVFDFFTNYTLKADRKGEIFLKRGKFTYQGKYCSKCGEWFTLLWTR